LRFSCSARRASRANGTLAPVAVSPMPHRGAPLPPRHVMSRPNLRSRAPSRASGSLATRCVLALGTAGRRECLYYHAVGSASQRRGSCLAAPPGMVVLHPHVGRVGTVRHQRMELETMTQTVPEQKWVINHRARTHAAPDPEGDLGVSGAGRDRERWTRNEPEPPHDGGLVVPSGCSRR
jgi:hypothetical protein